jgi:hypothetical protein
MCENHVGLQGHQLFRKSPYPIDVTSPPTNLDTHIAAVDPPQFGQPLREPGKLGRSLGITFGEAKQYAKAPHPAGFLRARCLRPQSGCTTEQRDELAPSKPMALHLLPLARGAT